MDISIIDPDARRFTRAGRPLRYWLLQLVDGDLNRRHRAARYVSKMHSESTEMPPDVDYFKYLETFDRSVQTIVAAPDFDVHRYVAQLVDVMRVSQAEQQRLSGEEQARQNGVTDRIEAQLKAAVDPDRKRTLERRLMRATCAGFDCRTPTAVAGQKHSFVSATAGIVFGSLGGQALVAEAVVRRMLGDPTLSFYAMEAIRRAPVDRAAPYVDDLLAQLSDDDGEGYSTPLIQAVAVAIKDDAFRVRHVFDRAVNEAEASASEMLSVLAYVGPAVRRHVPESVDRLAYLAGREDGIGWSAAQALGKIMARRPV
jgi:hypothetical protein